MARRRPVPVSDHLAQRRRWRGAEHDFLAMRRAADGNADSQRDPAVAHAHSDPAFTPVTLDKNIVTPPAIPARLNPDGIRVRGTLPMARNPDIAAMIPGPITVDPEISRALAFDDNFPDRRRRRAVGDDHLLLWLHHHGRRRLGGHRLAASSPRSARSRSPGFPNARRPRRHFPPAAVPRLPQPSRIVRHSSARTRDPDVLRRRLRGHDVRPEGVSGFCKTGAGGTVAASATMGAGVTMSAAARRPTPVASARLSTARRVVISEPGARQRKRKREGSWAA